MAESKFFGAELRGQEVEVTESLKETCSNVCGVVSEGSGLIFDAFSLAREEMKPMKIESRKETAVALAKAVGDLISAGFSEQEASQVILGGIKVA